jgi:hypothetical protein
VFRLLRWLAALFATSSAVAGEPDKPKAKLPLSKDTTFFTEPLDKDGYVDYETALNEQLRGTIKPADNAVVLLMQAIGPKQEGKELPPTFYKWLGTDPPLEKGDYLVPLARQFQKRFANGEGPQVEAQARSLGRQPLKAADAPDFAAWVAANEKPLAVMADASRKAAYYQPVVAPHITGGRGVLMATPLLASQAREIAGLLQLRITLRAGEGKAADAWDDVFTLFRLARLLSQGGTLVEWLVAAACEHLAMDAAVMLLELVWPTAKEARDFGAQFAKLPPGGMAVPKLALSERAICNDFLQALFRDGLQTLENYKQVVEKISPPNEADAAFREAVDWDLLFQIRRRDVERIEAADKLPTHAEREKAWATFLSETTKETDGAKGLSLDLKTFRKISGADARGTFTTKFAHAQPPLAPLMKPLCDVTYRTEQKRAILGLAFALAEHHADTGKYPNVLADLKPNYIKNIPGDLFSGEPLKYTKTDTGYLLYSVGVNAKDDGGRFHTDTPPGDDLGVRMPRELPK